jgi:uncharacterized protein (DUF488 family)
MPDTGGAVPPARVYSVGHSNHPLPIFLDLIAAHQIEVLVDVRSSPYARYATWFNRDDLRAELAEHSLKYVFMGDELGGRPDSRDFYDAAGHVRYERLRESETFRHAIDRLLEGARRYRVAVMCGEENPSTCHRHLLIGRELVERGVEILHIRADGRLQADGELDDLTLFRD